jgi:hypothetical protein
MGGDGASWEDGDNRKLKVSHDLAVHGLKGWVWELKGGGRKECVFGGWDLLGWHRHWARDCYRSRMVRPRSAWSCAGGGRTR